MAVDDSFTKALLHMNGADASTTFTDESGKTWTASGDAQIDTAQSKFGGASGLFDGTGDYISTPDSADWYLGDGSDSNSWTIDFWVRFSSLSATRGLVSQRQNASNSWGIHYNISNNALEFRVYSGGTAIVDIQKTWSPSTNTWYHIAVVKNGVTGYMMFVNGTQIGTTSTDTSIIPDFSGELRIGAWNNPSNTYYHAGWIDEFRLSKGIARWTSNFTPPVNPYAPLSGTGNGVSFISQGFGMI